MPRFNAVEFETGFTRKVWGSLVRRCLIVGDVIVERGDVVEFSAQGVRSHVVYSGWVIAFTTEDGFEHFVAAQVLARDKELFVTRFDRSTTSDLLNKFGITLS